MKIITRGFTGDSSSVITRGYLDAFTPLLEEVFIHFSNFRSRIIDFAIRNRAISFVFTTGENVFEITKHVVNFTLKTPSIGIDFVKRTTVFGFAKRVIEFIFRT